MSMPPRYLAWGAPRARAHEQAGKERLCDRSHAVPARDDDLRPVALDRPYDSLGDELGPDDDPAEPPASQPVLREALRVDEPRVDRVHVDPSRAQLSRN